MNDQEQSCRICRGEATEDQPLFHPCNCRGSIKYVHQECLFEWLKHSNKSTQKCDICNTEYKFKNIYDPAMPKQIPFKMIVSKLVEFASTGIVKSVSVALYIMFLLQLPMFWKFAGRVYTWAIDGSLPLENPSIIDALLLGGLDISQHSNVVSSESSMDSLFAYADQVLQYTYYSGVRHILVFVVVHIVLFIEREWVVRDEGYAKALLKKIGKEPRTKLSDMLQQALAALRGEGNNGNAEAADNVQQLEMLARAIDDLQHENPNRRNNHFQNTEEELRRFAEDRHPFDRLEDEDCDEDDIPTRPRENSTVHHTNNLDPDHPGLPAAPLMQVEPLEQRVLPDYPERPRNDEIANDDAEPAVPLAHPAPPVVPVENFQINNEVFDDEARAAREAEAIADAEDAAEANANGDGNIFEMFGFAFDIKTPLICTIFADSIIAVYLFVFYFIPHMIGSTMASVVRLAVQYQRHLNIFQGIQNLIAKSSYLIEAQRYVTELAATNEKAEFSYLAARQYFVDPVWLTFSSIFIEPNATHSTILERISLLGLGYSLIGFAVYKLMISLTTGNKPVIGGSRKLYKILFEITSTLKVFFIFALEIVIFPMYCGWLLDFCGAALVLPRFSVVEEDGSTSILLLLSSIAKFTEASHIRLCGYWVFGTIYMLCIALFVGMVRNKILRPGVLFFIRSPEDPNARLIHDALVKPLLLQLSRIYLSAKVYTAFIVAGIGGITWGMRLMKMEEAIAERNWIPSVYVLFPIAFFFRSISVNYELLQKYVHKYWERSFQISAHKMRLSHFILGKPVSQERGYMVYRNLYAQLMGNSQADYSRPTAYREALKTFKENPEVQVCFVPDGSYVRVPANDTVSRSYVKKLFVAVTKDDILINSNAPVESSYNSIEDEYSSEEEEDANIENQYTIVYRPPNLRLRCLGLLVILWVFSVIICVSGVVAALIVGRPVTRASNIVGIWLDFVSEELEFKNSFPLNWNVDIPSMVIGFQLMLILLQSFDKKFEEKKNSQQQVPQRAGNEDEQEPQMVNFADVEIPNEAPNEVAGDPAWMGVPAKVFLAFLLWGLWIGSMHLYCVEIPARFHFENGPEEIGREATELLLNKITIPLHLLMSYWTVFTHLKYPISMIRVYIMQNMEEEELQIGVWIRSMLVDLVSVWCPFFTSAVGLKFLKYDEYLVYDKALIFCVFAGFKLFSGLSTIYNSLLENVKNEKYMRGRTIQNLDD